MAITGIDTIEGKQIIAAGAVSAKSAEMAYNDENGNPITGYQVAGDYYSASNPSGFITGVDLTPYQLTADMTAYQPVGDYLTTADSANFYTTANESGYLTAVPDTYLQNTDLSTEDGKVTAISGIPLSAGGDVPEGVMVESGLEYNAVNEISAYNGSAIAQYGAEKQWLQHDDTIVHVANSAQYAFGVNLSAVAQLLGVDETVLFSGEASTAITLSESPLNFNKIRVYTRVGATVGGNQNFGCGSYSEFLPYTDFNCALITGMFAGTSGNEANIYYVATKWTGTSGKNWNRTFYGFRAYTATGGYSTAGNWISPYVIIGIGRKQ